MIVIKDLIDHVFTWPVTLIVLAFILRKSLGELINRLVSLKGPGFEASATSSAANQPSLAASAEGVKGLALSKVKDEAVHSDLDDLRSYGTGIPFIHFQEEELIKQLSSRGLTIADDAGQILLRQLAVHQYLLRAETTYRLILGSQIMCLKVLQIVPEQSTEDVLSYYQDAKTKYGELYGDYSADQWLNFLKAQLLVNQNPDNGRFRISVWGRDFLDWISSTGVREDKHY